MIDMALARRLQWADLRVVHWRCAVWHMSSVEVVIFIVVVAVVMLPILHTPGLGLALWYAAQ
jgi:hypothetical protein